MTSRQAKKPIDNRLVKKLKSIPSRPFFAIAFILIFPGLGVQLISSARAATVNSSVRSGNWSDATIWSAGRTPDVGDQATIEAGHTVTIDVATTKVSGIKVAKDGTLSYSPDVSSTIETSANAVIEGLFVARPANANVKHLLRFVEVNENAFVGGGMNVIDADVGLWVMGDGKLDFAGTSKTAWVHAAGAITQGTTNLNLKTAPTGWQPNDEITITPTLAPAPKVNWWDAYDTASLASISGTAARISSPTTVQHPLVNNKWTAEVMNLTRNVQIEGTAAGRSHIFIRSTQQQRVDHVGIRYMGPRPAHVSTARPVGAEPKWPSAMESFGRYGLHFHHMQNGSRGSTVTGTIIRDTGNHAFVPHASHGITFKQTISHNTIYDAYWWDGPRLPAGCNLANHRTCQLFAEKTDDTLYEDCIASKVSTIGNSTRISSFELGAGNGNSAIGCIAVGGTGGTDSNGFEWPEAAEGIWGFSNNIAHNNSQAGSFGWQNTGRAHNIIDFDAYYNNIGLEHGAYQNNYRYKGGTLYGNLRSGIQLHGVTTNNSPPAPPLRFEDIIIDGAGISSYGIETTSHNGNTNIPTLFRNMTVKNIAGAAAVYINTGGANPDFIDFIDSSIQDNMFYINKTLPNSVIRVQNGTESYELRRSDQGTGELIPQWNARKTVIGNIVPPPVQDTIKPIVVVNSPVEGQIIKGRVGINHLSTDNIGIRSLAILVDGTPHSEDSNEPRSVAFDSLKFSDGPHRLTFRVTDVYGNFTDVNINVQVANATPIVDTTKPLAPTGLRSTSVTSSAIGLAWNASSSSDTIKYVIQRNGVPIGQLNGRLTTTYTDNNDLTSPVLPGTTYSYQVIAVDASNNASAPTTALSVTTPMQQTQDTTKPTAPSNLRTGMVTSRQVSLLWNASTDNVAVVRYEISRNNTPVGTTITPGFADATLTASTEYAFSVVAVDASGNRSDAASVKVTTPAQRKTGDLNNDGKIDAVDLSLLLFNFNKPGDISRGDNNGDGKIDAVDLSLLLLNWTFLTTGTRN